MFLSKFTIYGRNKMKISKFLSICAILTCILASGCSKANVDNPNVQPSDDDTQVQNESTDGTDKATGTIKLSDEELKAKTPEFRKRLEEGETLDDSTEFRRCGEIIPENEFPLWTPSMVNDAFGQDDLYVEIPFLDAMKEHGADCEVKYLAEKFRDSQFPLWHANYRISGLRKLSLQLSR